MTIDECWSIDSESTQSYSYSDSDVSETDEACEEEEEEENQDDILLYNNSNITQKTFSHLLTVYSIQHGISGLALENLLGLFTLVLPPGNTCPTVNALRKCSYTFENKNPHNVLCKDCHSTVVDSACSWEESPKSNVTKLNENEKICYYIMDMDDQLQRIIQGISSFY